ncbi:hypothetical protein F4604DRAFT_1788395 [Suillus subluteus]|nr:hypothetical protein F4604DRAFT_1788395 [Suillus subluteus]
MKGLLSLVLVSIALLQTTAAVPAASARRGIVITRTPEIETKDLEGRSYLRYASGDSVCTFRFHYILVFCLTRGAA